MTDTPRRVMAPASFVPEHALAFADPAGNAVAVGADNPLPIRAAIRPSGIAPLSGSTASSGSFGPYAPALGRQMVVSLSGSWSGTVQLLRSIDGGATRLPLTAGGQSWATFTGNCNEPFGEEGEAGATYWLSVSLTSGTLTYRVAQ
jgi:hypothetical protein